jgi:hypothetical protein
MIAISRSVAKKHSFRKVIVSRRDQVLIAVAVQVAPRAVVSAFIGGMNPFSHGDVGKLPVAIVAIKFASLVSAGPGEVIVKEQVQVDAYRTRVGRMTIGTPSHCRRRCSENAVWL